MIDRHIDCLKSKETSKADNLEKALVCKEIACAEPVDGAVSGKHALSE